MKGREPGDVGERARVTCLADVESKEVEWLWLDRLPAGMVSVLDGPPAAGKSTFVADLIARLTTGRPLPPEDTGSRPPGNVVLLGHEDSAEHTIRPRLDAAGADANRVHLLNDIDGRTPSLPGDCVELERVVRETGASLLVIDPISAYIGKVDLHRDNEVRAALAPLALIGERTGAAVLLLRHLRKSGGVDALGRGLGSVGIIAMARTGLMLLTDPDDPKSRILAWSKMSVGPVPPSLRWGWQPGKGQPRIEWKGICDLSADEILGRQDRALRGSGGTVASAVDGAAEWLMKQFEESGVLSVADIKERAHRDNLAWRTIERAKSRMEIRARRENVPDGRGQGRWLWVAPRLGRQRRPDESENEDEDEDETKSATQIHLAAFANSHSNDRPNSAARLDIGAATKTAEPKAASGGGAVLVLSMEERADALIEGAAHA